MHLTPEQQHILISNISRLVARQGPCSLCNSSKWEVSDTIFELREFNGGDLVQGGDSIYPVIPITCSNCGNTLFLNAVKMGVWIPPDSQKQGGSK